MSQAFLRLSAKTKSRTPETSAPLCLLCLDLLLSFRTTQVGGWQYGLSLSFSSSANTLSVDISAFHVCTQFIPKNGFSQIIFIMGDYLFILP